MILTKEKMIKDKTACSLYISKGGRISDPKNAVTLGTTYTWRKLCREFERSMDVLTFHSLGTTKTKRQWDAWENNNMTAHIDKLLRRVRVAHDREAMIEAGLIDNCKGRGTWWELVDHDGLPVSLEKVELYALRLVTLEMTKETNEKTI
jgi:hypothetical protein